MIRYLASALAIVVVAVLVSIGGVSHQPASRALAQATPTPMVSACFNGTAIRPCQTGDVLACVDTQSVAPCPGPTAIQTGAGGVITGVYSIHFTRGDGTLRNYELAFTPPTGGTRSMLVAGYIHFNNGSPDIVLESGGTTPASVTWPSFPVGSNTWVGIQVDQNTGAVTLVTGTSANAVKAGTSTVHTLWICELPSGTTAAANNTNAQIITPS